ncbi:MAG: hypothetical protein AAF108_02835 [Planctomycetota bacterium]
MTFVLKWAGPVGVRQWWVKRWRFREDLAKIAETYDPDAEFIPLFVQHLVGAGDGPSEVGYTNALGRSTYASPNLQVLRDRVMPLLTWIHSVMPRITHLPLDYEGGVSYWQFTPEQQEAATRRSGVSKRKQIIQHNRSASTWKRLVLTATESMVHEVWGDDVEFSNYLMLPTDHYGTLHDHNGWPVTADNDDTLGLVAYLRTGGNRFRGYDREVQWSRMTADFVAQVERAKIRGHKVVVWLSPPGWTGDALDKRADPRAVPFWKVLVRAILEHGPDTVVMWGTSKLWAEHPSFEPAAIKVFSEFGLP